MSVSEREQAEPVHRERRMTITGFACGIMSLAAMCACEHRHKAKKYGDASRRGIIPTDRMPMLKCAENRFACKDCVILSKAESQGKRRRRKIYEYL
ncbi:MAG: hypothetical protein ACI4DR_04000 [Roseburia sp.]